MMHADLQTAVEAILKSKESVTMLGDLSVAKGGFCNQSEATDLSKLFTKQLFGMQGNGLGADATIDSWLQRAAGKIQSEFSKAR